MQMFQATQVQTCIVFRLRKGCVCRTGQLTPGKRISHVWESKGDTQMILLYKKKKKKKKEKALSLNRPRNKTAETRHLTTEQGSRNSNYLGDQKSATNTEESNRVSTEKLLSKG